MNTAFYGFAGMISIVAAALLFSFYRHRKAVHADLELNLQRAERRKGLNESPKAIQGVLLPGFEKRLVFRDK